jgi:hypothetical protein
MLELVTERTIQPGMLVVVGVVSERLPADSGYHLLMDTTYHMHVTSRGAYSRVGLSSSQGRPVAAGEPNAMC